MITLNKKLKKEESGGRRVSVRDRLLVREVQEMEAALPGTCGLRFPDPHALHEFVLTVAPDEGLWAGGKFRFLVRVPDEYNMAPPGVRCLTRLWHPNISEDGAVCLSLLRQSAPDGLGWAPTRRLRDVVWGLNSLFTDLLNFEDPLNIPAAELYLRDRAEFSNRVRHYIQLDSRS